MLVATAGHVDHGKTSLVKRLTGTDTDRLAEEKKRGLTIELGYAFVEHDANQAIGFIDVPGHHRFINTMISGITGIDLGMLVVAADDGVMPQTLEHLQLLHLLGVKRFIGVVSKSDLVSNSRLQQVIEQTSALIPGASVCPISNLTGDGVTRLQTVLQDRLQNLPKRHSETQFRMYIDRVFVKKGAGVVVTGTCLSGSASTGEELTLHTAGEHTRQKYTTRVREIHAQGAAAEVGYAGQRCALNLAGKISLERVHRGDFLCAHPTAEPAQRLDTRCWAAEESQHLLKHLGRVKLYIGTRRIAARTYFLDSDASDPSSRLIQLILDNEVLAFAGDRFVLRDDSESKTLGGGIVIDPAAPKARKSGTSRQQRLTLLETMEAASPPLVLEQLFFQQSDIVSLQWCKRVWNLSQHELDEILGMPPFRQGSSIRIRTEIDELIVSKQEWNRFLQCFDHRLAEWHRTRPMEPGIHPELLQTQLNAEIPAVMFRPVLNDRVRTNHATFKDQLVQVLGHKPTLSPQVQKEWQQLESCLLASALHIPLRSELQKETGFSAQQLDRLTRPAIKSGDLFEVGEKRLALPVTLQELAALVREFAGASGEISVVEAKQVFGLGRNLTIEILEFFDQIGFTQRKGNARVICNEAAALLEKSGD